MDDKKYEYGIWFTREDFLEEQHRTGMTRDEAERWVREWLEDGGSPGVFKVIRRELGQWEEA